MSRTSRSTIPESGGVFRAAGVTSAAVLASRLTGMLREVVMARFFGAGQTYDAFLLGMRIPNLARNLFAEGALAPAFIPVFTGYMAKGKRQAQELSDLVATVLFVAVSTACALGMIYSPELVHLMAPGFERIPGKFELAVRLTRIMFPFLVLVTLSAQAMGLLQACNRFGVPALASVFFNLGSLAAGLAIGYMVGRRLEQGWIISMAYGVVIGGMLQLLWQLPTLYRLGFPYRPRLDFHHEGLRRILALMTPALVGNAALQVNAIVNTNLASGLTDAAGRVINGPVSWLGYAFRFLQLPLGVFGVAIAAATLPAISRSAAARRMDEFRTTLSRSLEMVLLLTIPASVGLAVIGRSMIGTVYQWGRFQATDTEQTARALVYYSAGLAGYAAIKVLAPAFYALGDARTPMAISLISIVVNFAAAKALLAWTSLGHAGLALSTSLVALSSAAALTIVLRTRLHGFGDAHLVSATARIIAAAAVMGAVCVMSSRAVHTLAGTGKSAQFADVALTIPIGAAVFYVLARAFRVPQLDAIRHACYFESNASGPQSGDSTPGN